MMVYLACMTCTYMGRIFIFHDFYFRRRGDKGNDFAVVIVGLDYDGGVFCFKRGQSFLIQNGFLIRRVN
jgi:hypothetical protein